MSVGDERFKGICKSVAGCIFLVLCGVVGIAWMERDAQNSCMCTLPFHSSSCGAKVGSSPIEDKDGLLLCEECSQYHRNKCKSCNAYYIHEDSFLTTSSYCADCAETYAGRCDICGDGLIDNFNLVGVEEYNICTTCMEEYVDENNRFQQSLYKYLQKNSCLEHNVL